MNTTAMNSAHRAAGAFSIATPVRAIEPLGRGLINDTFLVTDAVGAQSVLQRINRRAFPNPERILENLRTLLAHVSARAAGGSAALRLPGIIPTRDRQDWTIDADGDFWRMLTYITGSVTHERLAGAAQAGEVGSALGRFHALVQDLPTERLHVVRGGFHQTPLYFERYREALARTAVPASAALDFCIEFANAREPIVGTLEDAKRQGVLALRVVHGDPKIDNILFDAASDRAISLIDLDTVQPGLLHYDVGDCLRSACNPAGESPATASAAHFDLGLCEALLTRYVAETRAFLTSADIRYLPDAIRLIPFELGLRFLADYLNGNAYFKVQWPEQNLLRAETQFRLTASIETQLAAIRALIADAVARA